MTTPSNFHEFPDPKGQAAGAASRDAGANKPSAVAKKYRPKGVPISEPEVSTLARFANYLMDRATGDSVSADQLREEMASQEVTNAAVAAAIAEDPEAAQAAIRLDNLDEIYAPNTDVVTASAVAGSPAFAYAFQRVVPSYSGACVKVRRSSDNAEKDVGFLPDGTLDTITLLDHVGSGDGFIRTWYDQSGNSRHLQQSTTTKQFQLVASGVVVTSKGQPACEAVRASSQTMQASAFSLSGTSSACMVAAFTPDDTTAGIIVDHGLPYMTGGVGINLNNLGTGRVELMAASASAATRVVNYTSYTAGQTQCVAAIIDPSRSTSDSRVRMRVNSADVNESATGVVGSLTTGCFLSDVLTVGCNKSGAGYYDGKIQMIAMWPDPSAEDLAAIESQLRGSSGMPLSFVASPSALENTRVNTPEDDFLWTNAFASAQWETTATTVNLHYYNDLYSSFPAYASLSVFVDGVYHSSVLGTGQGSLDSSTVFLPSGRKTVEIRNGLQSQPAGVGQPVRGTWLISLTANAKLSRVVVDDSSPLVIYGDSISVGGNSTVPERDGWSMLLRDSAPYPVGVEGWGFRSLWDDCSDGTARAAYVAKIVAWNPAKLWICIGTNDYGLNRWSAASFGTAYSALLDDLHAALPAMEIYCQTPLLRATETANGNGSTLGDYRTQITTACSTRAWATLVDGTAIMTTGSLADGVHPTDAGHVLYANYVKTILGIP